MTAPSLPPHEPVVDPVASWLTDMRIPASVRGLCGVSAAILVASAVWADEPKKVTLVKSDEQQFSGWAYSADGKRVATHWSKEQKGGIGVWDTATGKRLALIPVEKSNVVSVGISPDGSLVAAAGSIRLYVCEVATGKQTFSDESFVTTNDGPTLGHLAFSPDNKRVAVGCERGMAVWDLTAAKPKRLDMVDCEHDNMVDGFSPDGKQVVGATRTVNPVVFGTKRPEVRRMAVWDSATGKEVASRSDAPKWLPPASAFSPDGKGVASVGEEEGTFKTSLQLWDAASGKSKAALDLEAFTALTYVRFTPGGEGVRFNQFRVVSEVKAEWSVLQWNPAAKTTRTLVGGRNAEIPIEVGDSLICWGQTGEDELLVILQPPPPVEPPATAPKPSVTTLLRAKVPAVKK